MGACFPVVVKRTLIILVFIIIGIANGIVGPTLIYLEKLTSSREDEVTLVFTARAVGSLAGWLFGLLILDSNFGCKPYNLLCSSLFGLFSVFFLLPWISHLWWIMAGFAFQGLFVTLIFQGGLSFVGDPSPYGRHCWSHYLLFASLAGCILAPIIGVPFLDQSSMINRFHNSTIQTSVNRPQRTGSVSSIPKYVKVNTGQTDTLVPVLHRYRRAALPLITPIAPKPVVSSSRTPAENTTKIAPPSEKIHLPQASKNMTNNWSSDINNSSLSPLSSTARASLSKPSIVDAKHLSQEASAADGSRVAADMKQLSEERRIDTVNNVANNALSVTKVPPKPIEPTKGTSSTSLSDVTRLGNTNTPHINRTFFSLAIQVPDSQMTLNHTDKVKITNQSIPLATVGPPSKPSSSQTNTQKPGSLFSQPNTSISQSGNANNTLTKIGQSSSAIQTNLSNIVPTGGQTVTVPLVQKNTSFPPSSHRKYVLEHWSATAFSQPFFTLPLLPVQKVYLCVSFLVLFTWLLSLPFTDWCQWGRNWCPTDSNGSGEVTNEALRLRRRNATSITAASLSDSASPYSSPSSSQPLISDQDHNSSSTADIGLSDNVQPHTGINCNGIVERGSHKSGNTVILWKHQSMPVAEWPMVNWPPDAWLLMAEFLNSGLETAFGAFVYGFTMRYLLWSPPASLLVTSLFWLGDLVGRVPSLFLVEVPRLSRDTGRYRAATVGWSLSVMPVLRLAGGFLCVIVSVLLTRMSTDRCVATAQESSTNYFIWLFGSLLLGVGFGVSSNGPYSSNSLNVLTTQNRLFLFAVIGQLILPPLIGYVHHMAVFWRYSCVLISATLFISILLTIVLLVNLVRSACMSNENRPSFTILGGSF